MNCRLLTTLSSLLPLDTFILPDPPSITLYAQDSNSRALVPCAVVHARCSSSQSAQKSLCDSRHRDANFSAGSFVLLWLIFHRLDLCERHLSRYVRPYKVLHQVAPVTYQISPTTNSLTVTSRADTVRVSRLKLYTTVTCPSTYNRHWRGALPSGIMSRVLKGSSGAGAKMTRNG